MKFHVGEPIRKNSIPRNLYKIVVDTLDTDANEYHVMEFILGTEKALSLYVVAIECAMILLPYRFDNFVFDLADYARVLNLELHISKYNIIKNGLDIFDVIGDRLYRNSQGRPDLICKYTVTYYDDLGVERAVSFDVNSGIEESIISSLKSAIRKHDKGED